MTIVQITIIEGRSDAQKASMLQELTEAVRTALGVESDSVCIALEEVPAKHFAVAGKAKSGPSSTSK